MDEGPNLHAIHRCGQSIHGLSFDPWIGCNGYSRPGDLPNRGFGANTQTTSDIEAILRCYGCKSAYREVRIVSTQYTKCKMNKIPRAEI